MNLEKMSSEEYDKAAQVRVIKEVQDLVEGCIQSYMNKIECKHALQFRHKIDPYITELIWHRLEKENQEFFRAYYIRLLLIEQIKKFNMLLEEQVEWMHVIALSGVPPMHTSDPSPVLNRQQASPSEAARQNRPLEVEDMQKLQVLHNSGLSFQPSPQEFGNVPYCDPHNTQAYSVVIADVPSGASQDRVPLRTVDMQQQLMSHDFGSSIQSQTLRMGDVPYPAPQSPISYGAGPSNQGYFPENVYMSGYDPNFGSSHNLLHSQNQDAKMTQIERSIITREAVYDGSLAFNPSRYGNLVNLSPLTGEASINSLSSDVSNATNLNETSLEDILNNYFKTPSPETDEASCRNGERIRTWSPEV